MILYHALRNIENVFWIDVGANNPWFDSLTNLFYLSGSHGINIEANAAYSGLLAKERPRDINLNLAISDKVGEVEFPSDYGCEGTLDLELIKALETNNRKSRYTKVPADTLGNIIARHVPKNQQVHFCKIDIEGYEEKCLLGMN